MSMTALHVLAVAIGGALGGALRFWVSGVVARRFGERFPWGTLVVNVSGAALIGAIAGLVLAPGSHSIGQPTVWAVLVVGILGSYTTVSSFSLQTLALLRSGEQRRAAANVAASVSLCPAAAAATLILVIWMGT
jgi:CrcB protein